MNHNFLLPTWRHYSCWTLQQLPLAFRMRLLDRGSTTHRMRENLNNKLGLHVIRHDWRCPNYDELRALGIKRRQHLLVREVVLFCNERAWMVARTVIPRETLMGKGNQLRYLGNRPLGILLFADPQLQRSEFELALLRSQHQDYQQVISYCDESPATVWARRSLFQFHKKPLLLTEIFLPHPVLFEE